MAIEHDQRFAETQRDCDQDAYRHHRDQHVEEQLVRFLSGGFAVIASDIHLHVRWNYVALQWLDSLQHIAGDDYRVRALPLGD